MLVLFVVVVVFGSVGVLLMRRIRDLMGSGSLWPGSPSAGWPCETGSAGASLTVDPVSTAASVGEVSDAPDEEAASYRASTAPTSARSGIEAGPSKLGTSVFTVCALVTLACASSACSISSAVGSS